MYDICVMGDSTVHVRRSQENYVDLVLLPYMCSEEPTQEVRLLGF